MSRPLEARLARLEAADSASTPMHLVFLEHGEAEAVGIARQSGGVPPAGRLLVVRWARTDEEAISDPAGLAA